MLGKDRSFLSGIAGKYCLLFFNKTLGGQNFWNFATSLYSQVPNKRGVQINNRWEKLPKFNKQQGQNKQGSRNLRKL